MKRSTFLGAVVLLLAAVVSQSGSPVSVAAADTAPYYDQQPDINECTYTNGAITAFPCWTKSGDDEFGMRVGPCSDSVTNFCFVATVDNQPAPATLKFMATISAYQTHTSSNRDAGYEAYVNAYYVADGDVLSSDFPFGSSDRPADQPNGDGKVDLTPANIKDKVIKVVLKYKTVSVPQYSVVVADDGNIDFDLVGQDMTLTVEGKAARVAVDSATEHISFDREKSDDTSLAWANRCGIPSMKFVVCNVDKATTDGLMFYARSKSFTFPPGSTVPAPIWVSTNATYFHFPNVKFENNLPLITIKTAAPHFLADGTTLNEGNFSTFLPNGLLKEWGIQKTEEALKAALAASITKGTTETDVTPELLLTDDGVKVKFPKITFSAPIISVKQKAATSATTVVTVPAGKTLKRGKSVSLASLVKPVGAGKQTWSTSGGCAIKAKALVAPKRKASCKVTLKQAKSGKVKASTRSITVKEI